MQSSLSINCNANWQAFDQSASVFSNCVAADTLKIKKGNRLLLSGKHPNKVKVACAREMVGFVWESLYRGG
jgi:hypothetical protein